MEVTNVGRHLSQGFKSGWFGYSGAREAAWTQRYTIPRPDPSIEKVATQTARQIAKILNEDHKVRQKIVSLVMNRKHLGSDDLPYIGRELRKLILRTQELLDAVVPSGPRPSNVTLVEGTARTAATPAEPFELPTPVSPDAKPGDV